MIKHCEFIPDLYPEVIYAGTNKGVYYCFPNDSVWTQFSDELPLTIVNDLEIQATTGEIFAATYGRGIWKTNLINFTSISNEHNPNIFIYPNPCKNKFYIEVPPEIQTSNYKLNVSIINVLGYEKKRLELSLSDRIEVNHNLNPGVYFIIIKIGKTKLNGKILVQ